jgi:hypothetical protein
MIHKLVLILWKTIGQNKQLKTLRHKYFGLDLNTCSKGDRAWKNEVSIMFIKYIAVPNKKMPKIKREQ